MRVHGGNSRLAPHYRPIRCLCDLGYGLRSNNIQTFHGAGSATRRVGALVLINDDKGE